MIVQQLTDPMRRFVDELKRRRLQKRAMAARGRVIDCMELEDRILLSAAPLAPEAIVNQAAAGAQQTATQSPQAIAADAQGNYVVAWSSQNQDGNWDVYARRFNADGIAQGESFKANTQASNEKQDAKVAMGDDGSFVITWTDSSSATGSADIYARCYDADGIARENPFRVNTHTADDQMYSTVAMNANGDFVVVWSSRNQDGSGWGVYGQRYDASGNPLGSEFRVNTTTLSDQMNAQVAMDANGNFTVAWQSHYQDGDDWGIYARSYDTNGLPLGDEFQVNSTTTGDQQNPSLGMTSSGNFVVSWTSSDGSGQGIYAKNYNPDSTPSTGEYRVNTTTAGDQDYSSVAVSDSGAYIITWSSYNQDAPDTWGVYSQLYTSSASPDGPDLLVNSTTAGSQSNSSAAFVSSNSYVIVWSGNGVGDDSGVFSAVCHTGLWGRYANDKILGTPNLIDADVGWPSQSGSAAFDGVTWTVTGGGAGIGSTSDQFNFDCQNFADNGEILTQITSLSSSGGQAGLMFRNDTDVNSAYAAIVLQGNTVAFQWRSSAGGPSGSSAETGVNGPIWIKLSRNGNTISGYYGYDGVEWLPIGDPQTVALEPMIKAGLAVSACNDAALCTATFRDLTVVNQRNFILIGKDIGAPGLVGSTTYADGVYTISGGGNDLYSDSDKFHFASAGYVGDGTIVARIGSLTDSNEWALGGVMFRANDSAASPYVIVAATPEHGVCFQWRNANGSLDYSTIEYDSGSIFSNPVWVKLTRTGDVFSACFSMDGVTWTQFDQAPTIAMGESVQAGLAVAAANNEALCTATFSNAAVLRTVDFNWSSTDIGGPGLNGSTFYSQGDSYIISGGGNDLYSNYDQFNFVSQDFTGDGEIVTRIDSIDDTNPWALGGVMFRESDAPGARYIVVAATPECGVLFQWRTDNDAYIGDNYCTAAYESGWSFSSPVWVKLRRSGDNFSAFYSFNGNTWNQIGDTQTIAMQDAVKAGLAVAAADNNALCTVAFNDVTVTRSSDFHWTGDDLGSDWEGSFWEGMGNTYVVSGGGSDIGGQSDQFHYSYDTHAGDGTIVAHVSLPEDADPAAKAGVMFRNDGAADSAFADVVLTPEGVTFQWRSAAGEEASSVAVTGVTGSVWLKLVRLGNAFRGYYSMDGTTWTQIGSAQYIVMENAVQLGLAVTAHDDGSLCTATFNDVSVTQTAEIGFDNVDVGSPTLAGSTEYCTLDSCIIYGGGTNIGGQSDQFYFASNSCTGDRTIVAQITALDAADPGAEAGLMFRNDGAANSMFAAVVTTPGNGVTFAWRDSTGSESESVSEPGVSGPVWVKLVRSGNEFSGYYSTDGVSWTQIGTARTIAMDESVQMGLAVCSHDAAALCSATFDHVTVTQTAEIGFTGHDVGSPAIEGSSSYAEQVYAVSGVGNDMYGTSDQFHFASESHSGDGEIVARIDSFDATDAYAMAGAMFRDSLAADSMYVSVYIAGDNSIYLQWRDSTGGGVNDRWGGNYGGVPTWVKLVRTGDEFQGYCSADGVTWTRIGGEDFSITIDMGDTVQAGLAVSPNDLNHARTAVFSNVAIDQSTDLNFSDAYIGYRSHSSEDTTNVTYTVSGRGNDMYGTSDQFHFTSESHSGDGEIVARVDSFTSTDAWAMAGAMFRDSLAADSTYVSVYLAGENSIYLQWRDSTGGGVSDRWGGNYGEMPTWVKLVRTGDKFRGYCSVDGQTWTQIGGEGFFVTIDMADTVQAGLAVSSNDLNNPATATFSNVTIDQSTDFTLSDADSDYGSSSCDVDTYTAYTVSGIGNDISSVYDKFHFTSQTLTGDGELITRVDSLTNTCGWALVGLMIREDNSPTSPYAIVAASPGCYLQFQWRCEAGQGIDARFQDYTYDDYTGPNFSGPVWLKLKRVGNEFSAYYSMDSVEWTQFGGTQTIAMDAIVQAGLAVASSNDEALCTATFSKLSIAGQTSDFNFTDTDIGFGSTSFAEQAYTVTGSGVDIWGNTDQFHFDSQALTGDAELIARVEAMTDTDNFARAGLMFRDDLDPDSSFAMVYVTPDQGLSFQWRNSEDGWDTVNAYVPQTAPVWLKLTRAANSFSAYYSLDGVTWTQIGTSRSVVMRDTARAGLIVTSRNTGALCTGVFSHVSISQSTGFMWSGADIGAPSQAGSCTYPEGRYIVDGNGSDIWGNNDQFHYTYQTHTGDGEIIARLDSMNDVDVWAQVGLMFRDSLEPNSAFAMVYATPNQGISFRWRNGEDSFDYVNAYIPLSTPVWLKLTRVSDNFSGYYSLDGVTWTQIGATATVAMNGTAQVGLAVTSRNLSYTPLLCTGTFSHVSISQTSDFTWTDADIGAPQQAGGTTYPEEHITVTGTGPDIGGYSDRGYFVSEEVSGDATMIVQVHSITEVVTWTKAGIMFRDSMDPGSKHAMIFATPESGVCFQWRTSDDQWFNYQYTDIDAPVWLKLTRVENDFSGYYSTDGVNWIQVGPTVTMAMDQTAEAGLAVTSGDWYYSATGVFSDVSLTQTTGLSLTAADIGSPGQAGSCTTPDAHYVVSGSGADIWSWMDQFQYASQTASGDLTMITRVDSIDNTDYWAKAGMMFRDNLDSISRHAMIYVNPEGMVVFQWRDGDECYCRDTYGPTVDCPVWLKLTRVGNDFSGYYSLDGESWTQVGQTQTIVMSETIQAGLAVTSHNNGLVCTADFSNVSLTSARSAGPAGLTELAFERADPQICFDWGMTDGYENSPGPGIGGCDWSVSWQGKFVSEYTGTVTFAAGGDDGVRLWINDVLVADGWRDQGFTYYYGTFNLVAGQWYSIRMDYYQLYGGQATQLWWWTPSQGWEIIPTGNLSYDNVAPVNQVPDPQTANENLPLVFSAATGNAIQATDADACYGPHVSVAVSNGNFESPCITSGDFWNGDGAGWNFTQFNWTYNPDTDIWTPNNSGIAITGGYNNPGGPDGSQVGVLQGHASMWQDVNFAVAGDYVIGFDAAYREYGGPHQIEVQIDGVTVGVINPGSTSFQAYHTDPFSVTAGTHRVTFSGLNSEEGDRTAFIDRVSITSVDSQIQMSLAVDHGTLTLARIDGVTFSSGDGVNDAAMTFIGTWSSVNAALEGMQYMPGTDYTGLDNLRITTCDLAPAFTGGPRSDSDTIAINVFDPLGFMASYFSNSNFSGTTFQRIDPTIDFNWNGVSPAPGIGGTGWSARWTGMIEADYNERYTFHATVDGGCRLWVNDVLLIDQLSGSGGEYTGSIDLIAGQSYTLRMDYRPGGAGNHAQLEWSSASQVREVIPSDQVCHEDLEPVNSVPGEQTVYLNAPLVFSMAGGNAIQVTDADALSNPLRVTLTVDQGTLTLAHTEGLTFLSGDGGGDSTMTFSGMLADVNAALDGLWYLPTLNFTGTVNLQITTSDMMPQFTGGPKYDTDTVSLNVTLPTEHSGLLGLYYTGREWTGLPTYRIDPVIDFDWGDENSPAPRIPGSDWSAIWRGKVLIDTSGYYTFYTTANDGVKLFVNDVCYIDEWRDQAITTYETTIYLEAGWHPIRMEYYQHDSGAVAKLEWSYAGQDRQVIPADHLSCADDLQQENLAPVNNLPGTQDVRLNTPLVFSGTNGNAISIADLNSYYFEPLAVTLTVTNGTLSLGHTDWLTFTQGDGTNDATMTFLGWIGDINWALEGLQFIPAASYTGAADLQITTNDLAPLFIGGSKSDTDSLLLNVSVPADYSGLLATYYNNMDLTGTSVQRADPTINFNWNYENIPASGIEGTTWSARWEGKVLPEFSEDYTFYVTADDGVRLWVNDQLLCDGWYAQCATEYSGTIHLEAGQWYTIRMEYFQYSGWESGKLEWSSASQAREVIPADRLSHENTAPVNLVPSQQATDENTPLIFSTTNGNAIEVADLDGFSGPIQMTLSVNQELVSYSNFETTDLGTDDWNASVHGGSHDGWNFDPFEWTTCPDSGEWMYTGSGISRNNSGYTFANSPAPEGTQVAFIQGFSSMWQDVNFAESGDYLLSFLAACRTYDPWGLLPNTIQVQIDGVAVGTFTPNSTEYQSYETDSFWVSAGTHRVTFVGLATNGDRTTLIDFISIDTAKKTGTLTLAQTLGLTFVSGDGVDDSFMTFTGLPVDINAALDGLTYTPAFGETGEYVPQASLQIITNDLAPVLTGGAKVSTAEVPIVISPPWEYNGLLATYYTDWDFTGPNFEGTGADVGSPTLTGSSWFVDGDTFVVSGGGNGVGVYADQLHFTSQTLTGDGEIVARVTDIANGDPWARVGVMFRNDDSPGSAYAMAWVTPGFGASVNWRSADGGEWGGTGLYGSAFDPQAPVWLKLTRVGNNFTAFYSMDGVAWTQMGETLTIALNDTAQVGLTVSAANDAKLCTATFDHVAVVQTSDFALNSNILGASSPVGFSTYADEVYTLNGGGNSLRGINDKFHFSSMSYAGDGEIVARIDALEDTSDWAMAGVMFRDDMSPGSRYVLVAATPDHGVCFQWRTNTNASVGENYVVAAYDSGWTFSGPVWVKLVRNGDDFSAYYSSDGVEWTQVGTTRNIDLGDTVKTGLAVGAGNDAALCTATFSHVDVTSVEEIAFTDTDVGNPGRSGSSAHIENAYMVSGGGPDIGGYSDNGQFLSEEISGDVTMIVKVNSVTDTIEWAKGGLMIRDSLNPDAGHAMIYATPEYGIIFQWRDNAGAWFANSLVAGDTPVWLKLTRVGNNFSGYYSTDGVSWTQVGPTRTIAMGENAQGGLAVTSGNTAALCTATFSDLSITQPMNLTWTDSDIGEPALTGTTTALNGYYIVSGSGWDIWGSTDQFQYDHEEVTGDLVMITRVTSMTDTNEFARAGLMFRDSMDPDSSFAMVYLTPEHGVSFQFRSTAGGGDNVYAYVPADAPVWLKLMRSDNYFSAYYSMDGANWTQIGGFQGISMNETIQAGLIVTSRNTGALCTATFDHVSFVQNTSVQRVDRTIDDWWEDPDEPAPGVGYDFWSARWLGTITPEYTETYTFYATVDDACKIWIDGNLVLDQTSFTGETASFTMDLIAGQSYSFRMDFQEVNYGAHNVLEWSSASQAREVIPASAFRVADQTPIFAVPGQQSGVADQPIVFSKSSDNAIVIYELHNDGRPISVTLSVTQGTLSLGGVVGLTFTDGDGVDDTAMTFSGSIEAVNTALNGLCYTRTSGDPGSATLLLTAADPGASGGSRSSSTAVQIGSVQTSSPGLLTTFYSDTWLGTPVCTRIDPNINYNWGWGASPAPGVGASYWSASWKGLIEAPETGTYTFYATSDDGVRLWINGQLLIDAWYPQGATTYTATLNLTAGQQYAFRLDYNQYGAWQQVNLEWSGPNLPREVVPASQFSHMNQPPINYLPASTGVVENTSLTLSSAGGNAISVNDPDAPFNLLQITLMADHGTFSLSGTEGLEFSAGNGLDDGAATFTGSLDAINAALNGLAFTPDADYSGPAALRIITTNLGTEMTTNSLLPITVQAVNHAPELEVPDSQSVLEHQTLTFSEGGGNALQIGDEDIEGMQTSVPIVNGSFEEPDVSVAPHGFQYAPDVPGWTFTSNSGIAADGSVFNNPDALDGTQVALLQCGGVIWQDVTFTEAGTYVISFEAAARNYGSGVNPFVVEVDGINIGTFTPGAYTFQGYRTNTFTVTAGTHRVTFRGLNSGGDRTSFIDRVAIDKAESLVQVSLAVNHGRLSLSGALGLTFSQGSGNNDTAMTLTGTLADINAALEGLQYVPVEGYDGSDTLRITTNDLGNSGVGGPKSTTSLVPINVSTVNDPPVNTVPGSQGTYANHPIVFSYSGHNVIRISDPDAGSSPLQVTLTAANGTLTLDCTSGLTFSDGDGSGDASMTFSGTMSDINAALDGLCYVPAFGFIGTDSLQIATNDLGHSGAGGPKTVISSVAISVAGGPVVNSTFDAVQQTFPQSPQAVAADANGNYVVVWSSQNQDGSGWGVFARRFNAAGIAQGSEFQVNSQPANDQMYATVAVSADGRFVITWTDCSSTPGSADVYARCYNAEGMAQSDPFLVNTHTSDDQMYSSVALSAAGEFVITWSSQNQDGDGWGVYGQRYNAFGNPQGAEFQVNTTTGSDQMYSRIAIDENGNFTIVWQSRNQDSDGWGVYGQRYDASGNPLGAEFRVNTTTAGDQQNANVGMNASGSFVVSWSSSGQDGSGQGIYAQRYNADGSVGGEFQVNTTTAGDQDYSSVAVDRRGNFLITWSSFGQDTAGAWGVYSQRYAADGTANGPETRVNTTTEGSQTYASVTSLSPEDYLVVWSGSAPGETAGVFYTELCPPGLLASYYDNMNLTGTPVQRIDSTINFVWCPDWSQDVSPAPGISADFWSARWEGLIQAPDTGTYTFYVTADDGVRLWVNNELLIDQWHNEYATTYSNSISLVAGQWYDLRMEYYQYNGPDSVKLEWSSASQIREVIPSTQFTYVNPAPVQSLPGTQSTNEDTPLVFSTALGNALQISDLNTDTVEVTLSIDQGTLTLNGTTGLTFLAGDGADDAAMTILGTLNDINAALNGLQFTPRAYSYGPANLEIITNDLGSTGIGGPKITSSTLAIDVIPVNNAPVNTVPGLQGVMEHGALIFSNATGNVIRINDLDADNNPVQVTLTVDHGTLSLSSTGGLTFTSGDGTEDAVMILRGTINSTNEALDGLRYVPADNYDGIATLQIITDDLGNVGIGGSKVADSSVAIAVTAVNDPPVNMIPDTQNAYTQYPKIFSTLTGNAIRISDPDADDSQIKVTLSVDHGTLSLSRLQGLTFDSGDGIADQEMTILGTLADINAALDGLQFKAADSFEGEAHLQIATDDLGYSGIGGPQFDSDSVTLNVARANEAPVNTVPASTQSVEEHQILTFSTIRISDPDAGDHSVQVTLSVDHGTLSLGSANELTFLSGDGSHDETFSFVGKIDKINAALESLEFHPADNYDGIANLTITTDDLGNTGAGGPISTSSSVAIHVTAVNDPPAITALDQQHTYEHQAMVFSQAGGNAIRVSDPDAGDHPVQVTLAVDHGVLSLSGTQGLTFSSGNGTNNAVMTFTGTMADINAALDGMQFMPVDNYNGLAGLQITVNDFGGTGIGGSKSSTRTVPIGVTAVNDPPEVTFPQLIGYDPTEILFSSANGNAIRISDPDAGNSPVLVTIMARDAHFNLADTSGLSILGGTPLQSTFIIIYGSLGNVNHAIDGLFLKTTSSYAALQVTVNDLGGSGVGGPKLTSQTLFVQRSVDPKFSSGDSNSGFHPLQGAFTQPAAELSPRDLLPEAQVQINRPILEREQVNAPLSAPRDTQNTIRQRADVGVLDRASKFFVKHSSEKISADVPEAREVKPLKEGRFPTETQSINEPITQDVVLGWDDSILVGIGVVSAGYLAWALNGGSLLAGALSATPMWKPFDPLAVLEFSDRVSKSGLLPTDGEAGPISEENLQTLLS